MAGLGERLNAQLILFFPFPSGASQPLSPLSGACSWSGKSQPREGASGVAGRLMRRADEVFGVKIFGIRYNFYIIDLIAFAWYCAA